MFRITHLERLASWAATVLRAAIGVTAKRVRRGDLSRMDDRMLHDIGLTRHDVWSVPPDPLLRDRTASIGGSRSLTCSAARERSALAALRRLWAVDSGTT